MTKPNIWSRMLHFHEISILATGCGGETSPDIATKEDLMPLERRSFTRGECISGKGEVAEGRVPPRETFITSSLLHIASPSLRSSCCLLL